DRPQRADDLVRALDEISTPSGGTEPADPARRVATRRSALILIAAIALVCAVGILGYALARSRIIRADSSTGAREKRLAVIPFETVGRDTSSDWFADGITDELTAGLGNVPGLPLAP